MGNGWKMPSPQTISCKLKDTGTYQARIDSDGQIYTLSPHDVDWVRGASAPTTRNNYPVYAAVGLQGLEGHGTYTETECYGGGSGCHYYYYADTCAAMWAY